MRIYELTDSLSQELCKYPRIEEPVLVDHVEFSILLFPSKPLENHRKIVTHVET